MIDLYRLNLNLLVALDVLLKERSVTQAANKLFITQAAMSNNLQQLREIFKDDLLIREKTRMVPTSYALSLQAKLHEVLEELRTIVLVGQRFLPELSQRNFKIMMTDYMSSLILPKLLKTLEQEAPNVSINVVPLDRNMQTRIREESECDLAICKSEASAFGMHRELLFKDEAVCVLNPNHPLAQKEQLTFEDYLASEHVAICLNNPEIPALIEEALMKLNQTRKIKVALPFVGSIFQVIENSCTLVGTAPLRVAELYQKQYHFVIKKLPFPMDPICFNIVWHERYQNDLGHIWLREKIMHLVKAL